MKFRILVALIALFVLALPLQAQDVEVDDITFARDVSTANVTPIQVDEIFPSSLTAVYAVISGEGLEEGDEIEIVWMFDGDELDTLVYEKPDDSDEFRIWTNWSDPDGLEEGDWEVQILFDDDVIASEEFEITDDEYVFPVRFSEECGRTSGILAGEGEEFEDLTYLYAYVEYANFDEETIEIFWTIDGDELDLDLTTEFDGEGWACFFLNNGGDPMPEGDYGMIVADEDGDEYRESEEVEVSD